MLRRPLALSVAAGLLVVVAACFGPAIRGRQFSYRDAAHYYYPLYQRVQAEWDAGRVPLWESEENAGMPLLGNPTAAVLYPGKIIYTLLPYPLAARVYVIVHTLWAFAGMLLFARRLGIGATGGAIAAFGYAFGAPILFQYCNVIFLVGAAWVPWGMAAIDGWLRRGSRASVAGLAVVLAMQVLGGDPQAAYIEGLCAGAYAILLSRGEGGPKAWGPGGWALFWVGLLALVAAWVVLTLGLAHYLPQVRSKQVPTPTFVWVKYIPIAVAAGWGAVGVWFVQRWARGGSTRGTVPSTGDGVARLGRRLAGLVVAAGLAGALAGAQLLPVLEFTGLTGRSADEGSHDVYPFSLEPYRVAELVWPSPFGTTERGNRSWLLQIPPVEDHRIWVPSLYLGGITLVLALRGLVGPGGPAWRGWVVGIAGVSLVAAMGQFAGPLWVARNVSAMVPLVGPHDPAQTNTIRLDGFLRDGDGSVYSVLAALIPGFQQFRYPSKLLTFTVLALSVLAGLGWDRLERGERRGVVALSATFLGLSLLGLVGVTLWRESLLARLSKAGAGSSLGPFQPAESLVEVRRAFIHGVAIFSAAIAAALLARRRPRLVGALVVLVVAVDLAAANGRFVLTSDQAEFDRRPKALEIIDEAERREPAGGPFRIHRMAVWNPADWVLTASDRRNDDFVRWERDTIQPKYGLPYGVKYTHTQGVAELYDYEWFFAPFTTALTPDLARSLRIGPRERIVYYPRRGFDLWNTRYFLLPGYTRWTDSERGVASLLHETDAIYPPPGAFDGPGGPERQLDWLKREDLQIVRNRLAMPRAWVVHDAKFFPPIDGLVRAERARPMEEMLYMADPYWYDRDRVAHDPKAVAWFEVDDTRSLSRFATRGTTAASEAVTVVEPNPRRVELSVSLDRPGFVILADVFYPGWTLTVDGKPTPILRANRLMRGAALESGRHVLVYEYRPRSFALGMVASLGGLLGLASTGIWALRRGPRPTLPLGSRPD